MEDLVQTPRLPSEETEAHNHGVSLSPTATQSRAKKGPSQEPWRFPSRSAASLAVRLDTMTKEESSSLEEPAPAGYMKSLGSGKH